MRRLLKLFFLPLIFIMSGCYIYQPYSEEFAYEEGTPDRGSSAASATSLRGTAPVRAKRNGGMDRNVGDADRRKMEEEKRKYEERQSGESSTADAKEEEQKRKQESEREKEDQRKKQEFEKGASKSLVSEAGVKARINSDRATKSKIKKEPIHPDSLTLKDKIRPGGVYKINVDEKRYKIEVDTWEGDTLVSHRLRNEEKVYRFHENQIDEESLLQRNFSKTFSDLITIGSYVGAGGVILLLLL